MECYCQGAAPSLLGMKCYCQSAAPSLMDMKCYCQGAGAAPSLLGMKSYCQASSILAGHEMLFSKCMKCSVVVRPNNDNNNVVAN
ncbi:hypothetical protein PoB_007635300 [Plakobranchus ocellatus]|uniref:Uncharacterized protein n=1 Tax=Plakobranchus ocellatus TaxID=259542 RepID=A0AAV4DZY6_9GAST|nr:hypothetical protein PoB_007635300 [Plakobranchus ocellatus]